MGQTLILRYLSGLNKGVFFFFQFFDIKIWQSFPPKLAEFPLENQKNSIFLSKKKNDEICQRKVTGFDHRKSVGPSINLQDHLAMWTINAFSFHQVVLLTYLYKPTLRLMGDVRCQPRMPTKNESSFKLKCNWILQFLHLNEVVCKTP